jgi:hypothetical protein
MKSKDEIMQMATPEGGSQSRDSNDLARLTGANRRIDRKRFSPAMANRPPSDLDTKNPGSLAGHTGIKQGSAGELEQAKSYSIPAVLS